MLHASARLHRAAVLLTVDRTVAPELQPGEELEAFQEACAAAGETGRSASCSHGIARTAAAEACAAPTSCAGSAADATCAQPGQGGRKHTPQGANASAGAAARYCGQARLSELCSVEQVVLEASMSGAAASSSDRGALAALLPVVRPASAHNRV